jgi:hypothetical protein
MPAEIREIDKNMVANLLPDKFKMEANYKKSILAPKWRHLSALIGRWRVRIDYNLFQNQKSTTCWIMLAETKKSLE